jgi:hypothetical protein
MLTRTSFAAVVALVVSVSVSAGARAAAVDEELTNVVTIVDPYAHAQDLVALPGLSRLIEGPLKKSVAIADVKAGLAATAPFWPRELAIAMPTSGFARVGGFGRLFALSALSKGAIGAGARGRKELQALQKDILAELKSARLPALVVSATFGDPVSAQAVATAIGDLMRESAAGSGAKVVKDGGAVGLHLRWGAVSSPPETKASLIDLGWLSGPRDPQAKALGAAVARLETETWVAAEGTRVVLTLGPRRGGKIASASAPPVPLAAGQLLATGRMEIGPWRAIVADWRALVEKWAGTAAAARMRSDDDTDLLGELPRMARALERVGQRWESWLWVDRGVHLLSRQPGAPASAPLASEPVASLLPAAAVAVDVDTRDNVGDRLSDLFSRIEERLARSSLSESVRSDARPGKPGQPGKAERAEVAFYAAFAKLRELIHEKGPSLFAGGSAFVVGPGARIGRLEVRDAPNAPARTYKNVAVPEFAWIGRASDPRAAVTFFADVWKEFGAGINLVWNPATRVSPPQLTDAPAPLPGASARWLDTSWIDALVGGRMSSDDGFKPQLAVQGDVIVLSTSPGLIRQILSLGGGAPAKGRLALPRTQAPLVAWSRYPCAPLVAQLRTAFAASETAAGRTFNFGTPKDPTTPKDLMDVGAAVCTVVDGLTITTVEQGGVATTTLDAPAAPGLYKASKPTR